MQLSEGTDQVSFSPPADATEHEESVPAAKVDAPPKQEPKPVRKKAYQGLTQTGVIYGNVGTLKFNVFVTGKMEKMDYVQVEHEEAGWVLCQITEIERRTNLTVEGVASSMKNGIKVPIDEKEIATATIIGFRDDRNLLQVPRTPMRAGAPVFRAKDEMIKDIIGIEENSKAGAYIGLLSGHDIRIELDINKLVQRHVCILSMTGGGKSYCSGALIEEMMKHNVTVCILDPHGEYSAMKEKGAVLKKGRDFGVTPRGYKDKIMEFATDTNVNRDAKPLKFTLHNLDARDLLALMPSKNVRAYLTMLRKTIDVLKETKENYTVQDIIAVLEAGEDSNASGLISELEYLKEIEVFAEQGTNIDELIQKGKTTIINLRGTPTDIQELIVNRVCTALFELRKTGKLPPMMLVVEEAHNFCPQQGQKMCSKIFRTIASEGRKFGLGLLVITQRPAKIDKNVLSQCNTQIILKVVNANDVTAISQSIEGFVEGMDQEMQRLPIGTAIVTGAGIQFPLFLEVRPRESKHGGESIKVVE
jgi:hypothetical protein